jgi:hypothetical protein
MFLLHQRSQPLAFCCNRIDHLAAPIFAFLCKPLLELMLHSPRDPRIEPLDQVKGPLKASLVGVVQLLASS